MPADDNLKIEQIIELRKKTHSFYLKKSKVYKSFVEMEQNTFKDGSIKKKEKE